MINYILYVIIIVITIALLYYNIKLKKIKTYFNNNDFYKIKEENTELERKLKTLNFKYTELSDKYKGRKGILTSELTLLKSDHNDVEYKHVSNFSAEVTIVRESEHKCKIILEKEDIKNSNWSVTDHIFDKFNNNWVPTKDIEFYKSI